MLYLGNERAVQTISARLGVDPIPPANPYWARNGTTFQDPDGFSVARELPADKDAKLVFYCANTH